MRLAARVGLLMIVAAAFVWLGSFMAHGVLPGPGGWERRVNRPAWPRANRWPSFVGEFVLFGTIAVGGRLILRLRLTERARS